MFTAEKNQSSTKQRAMAFALAGGLTVMAACSSPNKPEVTASTLPPETTTTTTQPELKVDDYLLSPERQKSYQASLEALGQVVIDEFNSGKSSWGPFDAFCVTGVKTGKYDNMYADRWTSRGYVPQPGDTCALQHNPQYGGSPDQVIADVSVGASGEFTFPVTHAFITREDCSVFVMPGKDRIPATAGIQINGDMVYAGEAQTPQDAQVIDAQVLACLDSTRP